MRCPSCDHDNRPDRRFCAKCGAPLGNPCAACGTQNEPDEHFCGSCGKPLSGAPVPAASGVDRRPRPAAATPDDPRLAAERRQLTVMFCDLVGSTELSQRLDAEDLRSVVRAYQEAASGAIRRYDGHIAQYLGDGLLVYFGYPQAHEDAAERAVRAGLEILTALSRLNDTLEPTHRIRLAARVGIHTGPVVIGEMGGGAKSEVLALGDTTNIAARVQALAGPDTVLVTAATHRLVAGLFVVEEGGAQALGGVREPVAVYRVLQPSGVRRRNLAAAAVRGLTPFVGREEERGLLLDRWDQVQEGAGQVVLITGEAGIGKSRLVQQFKEDLGTTPHTWIECGGSPFHSQTPFHAIAELMQRGFAWESNLAEAERVAALEQALGVAGLNLAEAVPIVAPLLNVRLPERYPSLALSPEQQRKRLFATLVAWVLAMVRLQPTVIVTEDLHWVDPSTLETLGLLVEQGATIPLLLLYTARPEFHPSWPLQTHHAQVRLNRLGKRHVREMIVQVTARALPPGELVEVLATRTDGVPLFVEELTRAVLEAEGAALVTREIPATLHDTLMARLDRLGPAKEVAQIASMIGREFSYALLQAVIEVGAHRRAPLREEELQTALNKLIDAELVYARGVPPDATYLFKHALVHETAYGALLKSRRRELHRVIASVLTERFSALAAAQPAVLAYHWEAAGEVEAAVTAWQQAAEQAQRTAAVQEAEAHYRRALAALVTLPDGPARAQIEMPLQVALFFLLTITRGPGDAATEEAITRAAALAEQLGDAPQAVLVLAGSWAAALTRNEQRAALAIARQMVRLAERDGGAVVRVMAHSAMGLSLIHLGELDAGREHLDRVLALWNDDDFHWLPFNPKVMSLGYLAYAEWVAGRSDSAHQREQEAATAGTQRGVLSDAAMAEVFAMTVAGLRRESAGMAERARRFLKLCADHDLSLFLGGARVFGGWILACEEDPAEGIALLREGLRGEQAEGGAKTLLAIHLSLLAEVYAQGGVLTEALATLDEAFAALGDEEIWRPDLLRLRGDLLVRTVDSSQSTVDSPRPADEPVVQASPPAHLAEAEQCYREAIDRARAMGATAYELRATVSLARLLHSQGCGSEARQLLAPLYASFTEGFDTRDLHEAKALLDDLA